MDNLNDIVNQAARVSEVKGDLDNATKSVVVKSLVSSIASIANSTLKSTTTTTTTATSS